MNAITDYGDKIGGAKKDLFSEALLRLSMKIDETDPFFAQKSFGELFPKPNYEDLSKKGLSHTALAAICAARGSVDRKPTGRNAAREVIAWLSTVKRAKDLAIYALSADPSPEQDAAITEMVSAQRETLNLTFRTLQNVPADTLGKVEGLLVMRYRNRLSLVSGRKTIGQVLDTAAPEPVLLKAFADAMVQTAGKEKAASRTLTPEQRAQNLLKTARIYTSKDKLRSVEIRNPSGQITFATGLASLEAARTWFRENRPAMVHQIVELMAAAPKERTGIFTARIGPARRDCDVTTDMLSQTFGLRGIEFGEYVNGKRRQEDLNGMWDALSDLAEVLGVPTRAIGAHGALAIAFGARGGGRAMAHFERDRRVFNLTRDSGSGSTGHEWFHFGDNSITMETPTDKNSRSPKMFSALGGAAMQGLSDSWASYEARMSAMDATRSKAYWSAPQEMAARCFEVWLVDRLADLGIRNDHLVEIDRHSEAYPTAEEMLVISPHIEIFVHQMMHKISLDAESAPEAPLF